MRFRRIEESDLKLTELKKLLPSAELASVWPQVKVPRGATKIRRGVNSPNDNWPKFT